MSEKAKVTWRDVIGILPVQPGAEPPEIVIRRLRDGCPPECEPVNNMREQRDVALATCTELASERDAARKDATDYAYNLDQFWKQRDAALALVREAKPIMLERAMLAFDADEKALSTWLARARSLLGME